MKADVHSATGAVDLLLQFGLLEEATRISHTLAASLHTRMFSRFARLTTTVSESWLEREKKRNEKKRRTGKKNGAEREECEGRDEAAKSKKKLNKKQVQ